MAQRKSSVNVNQSTTISVPKIEYIPTDKKMWESIKRRVSISDKLFDFKDIALLYIGAVAGGRVSYFSVEKGVKAEYVKWLIILSIVAFLVILILGWMKYQKKEFTNTILTDMHEIENC